MQILRSKKNQKILIGATFVFLFSFGLAQSAMASILSDIGQGFLNAILGSVGLILGLIFNILGTLTGFFLGLAVLIFNWVSSPGFISLSYTNVGLIPSDPNFNQFVGVGWELTRGLTNIIFVLAMVVIGIGTALRISGYQMQKTLPTLILIALLINFTPVIAGLIIDASNITMGFFINPEGSAAGSLIWQKSTSMWQNVGQLTGAGSGGPWSPTGGPQAFAAAAASLALIFFNLAATIIYLLFAGVFILRYIALWLLIILSPFAFACYILPYTRGVWSQWWKAFIQWSILGIIAGFFLYLSEHIYSAFNSSGSSSSFSQMNDLSSAPGLAPIINGLLPAMIPIVLLFVGFVASISGAPAGAQTILKAGEKVARSTAQGAAWATVKKTATAPKAAFKSAKSFFEAKRAGFTTRDSLGEAGRDIGRWIKTRPVSGPGSRRDLSFREMPGAAFKGVNKTIGFGAIKKAVGDTAKGVLKTKKKKKGDSCPQCKKTVNADADYCPDCGFKF